MILELIHEIIHDLASKPADAEWLRDAYVQRCWHIRPVEMKMIKIVYIYDNNTNHYIYDNND